MKYHDRNINVHQKIRSLMTVILEISWKVPSLHPETAGFYPGGHVKEENASSRGRAETTMFQVWVNALLCRATQMDLLKVESGAEERNFVFFF